MERQLANIVRYLCLSALVMGLIITSIPWRATYATTTQARLDSLSVERSDDFFGNTPKPGHPALGMPAQAQPRNDLLENPVAPAATRVVASTADSGPGTLRQAMLDAQAGDTITFSPTVFPTSTASTIFVQSALPTLTRNDVTIDASNAGVILDGSSITITSTNGIKISGANGVVIRGLQILHFPDDGIEISGGAQNVFIGGDRNVGSGPLGEGNLVSGNGSEGVYMTDPGTWGNVIQGNYIGVNLQGTGAVANADDGIHISQGTHDNVIGGTTPGRRNLVSGNRSDGVFITLGAVSNTVRGNLIGTDASGYFPLSNGDDGVHLSSGAYHNTIGGKQSGEGNLISGNAGDGIYLWGVDTRANDIQGNYVGTRMDGMGAIRNGQSGIAILSGAQNNRIGGTALGEGNLISGNRTWGIYICDPGTSGNQVLGNIIGPDKQGTGAIGNGLDGIIIRNGASYNVIGNGTVSGRNVLSANGHDGLHIEDSDTVSNTVQGNIMGANLNGTAALPNGASGVELSQNTHHNLIGGNRLSGQGNLLSGNLNHGLVILSGAHHNTVMGNILGPDTTGNFSLGNHPFGAIDIAGQAHDNVIGGLAPGEGNLISGNQTDGIFLFNTYDNQLLGNTIGLTLDGSRALSNGGPGVFNVSDAVRTWIEGNTVSGNQTNGVQLSGPTEVSATVTSNRIGTDLTGTLPVPNGLHGVLISDYTKRNLVETNTIAFNLGAGIRVESCYSNTLTQNSIYSNTLTGIASTCGVTSPQIITVSLGTPETIAGTAVPNARVEVYSDDAGQGRIYDGYVLADSSGNFVYTKTGQLNGPNLTATNVDTNGNTSEFSKRKPILWTVLLYLNGDNDLEEAMFDTFNSLVAAGPSPRANVLVLLDGYTTTTAYSGTMLYDVTYNQAISISTHLTATNALTVPGELNMGNKETLIGFVEWGRAHYPSRHTLLSIVDHGGGWAPSTITQTGGMARRADWMGGKSGLSWDFSDGYDHLTSQDIHQAFATFAANGGPLDVAFFDVCLMGMIEVAYEVKNDASFFVSSQNIAWAPTGPQNRYVQLVQGIGPATTPRQMAELAVTAYAASMPSQEHPFTISAIDLSQLLTVTARVDQLGIAISQTLVDNQEAMQLYNVYTETQKIDYDTDFEIEPMTEGFVDLYDFALRASRHYTDPAVITAANALTTSLSTAIVAEQHFSGNPWVAITRTWNFENAHGLSIFLPLGEDLQLSILITETLPTTHTRNLSLRELYSSDQLNFVGATAWKGLIDNYYTLSSTVPVTMSGPVGKLPIPDTIPPQTVITVTGSITLNQNVTVTWITADTQSGLDRTVMWYQPPKGKWQPVITATGDSGIFTFTWPTACESRLAILSTDKSGNMESSVPTNTLDALVQPCLRTLSIGSTGNGTGAVSETLASGTLVSTSVYLHGSVVMLTAVPSTTSSFTRWSGAVVTTTNPVTLTMDSNKTVTATFTLNTYTLTINHAGNGIGTVTASPVGPTFTHGTVVTLTAVPSNTSAFGGWSIDVTGSANPITLTMDSNKTVIATFITYRLYLPLVLR